MRCRTIQVIQQFRKESKSSDFEPVCKTEERKRKKKRKKEKKRVSPEVSRLFSLTPSASYLGNEETQAYSAH
jgi:hypothetical protein